MTVREKYIADDEFVDTVLKVIDLTIDSDLSKMDLAELSEKHVRSPILIPVKVLSTLQIGKYLIALGIKSQTRVIRVKLCSGYIADWFPAVDGPDGDYYMIADKALRVFKRIYAGDTNYKYRFKRYYISIHDSCYCRRCENTRQCFTVRPLVNCGDHFTTNYYSFLMCSECIERAQSLIECNAKIIEKTYIARIRPWVSPRIRLLLLAHARDENSPFYKYNLSRDVFKMILLRAFPLSVTFE